MILYEWNAAKSARNFRERGIDFEFGVRVFEGNHQIWLDTRKDYGEPRFAALGKVDGLAIVVVFTERDDARRIISVRRASRRERKGKWAKLFVKH